MAYRHPLLRTPSSGRNGHPFRRGYGYREIAQFGLLWDAYEEVRGDGKKVFPPDSPQRTWAEAEKAELTAYYDSRYGETYVGERFLTPYHCGNNPILGDALAFHRFLIKSIFLH